jgi:predicted amidohydrolase
LTEKEVKRFSYKFILLSYRLLLVLEDVTMISYCMKASFFQFNSAFGKKSSNIEKVRQALSGESADLLVLPEFFATGYQFVSKEEVAELAEPVPDGQTTEFLATLSREKDMYIVAGLPERDGNKFYNSAVLTGPDGFIGRYRKTHLFYEENLFFVPGDTGFRVWDTPIGKIGIMICFDWFFPESARTLALKGAEVIAHPSNLVLPYCPQSMPVRCLENRVYAVTANRIGTEQRKDDETLTFIGQSQITSPKAEILVRAGTDEEILMTADIDLSLSRDKKLNQFNDLLKDRRPEYY